MDAWEGNGVRVRKYQKFLFEADLMLNFEAFQSYKEKASRNVTVPKSSWFQEKMDAEL